MKFLIKFDKKKGCFDINSLEQVIHYFEFEITEEVKNYLKTLIHNDTSQDPKFILFVKDRKIILHKLSDTLEFKPCYFFRDTTIRHISFTLFKYIITCLISITENKYSCKIIVKGLPEAI